MNIGCISRRSVLRGGCSVAGGQGEGVGLAVKRRHLGRDLNGVREFRVSGQGYRWHKGPGAETAWLVR